MQRTMLYSDPQATRIYTDQNWGSNNSSS